MSPPVQTGRASSSSAPASGRTSAKKEFAWRALHLAVLASRALATIAGRRRPVGWVIYKVDRLGDWLLASAAIDRLAQEAATGGHSLVVWASEESAGLRSELSFRGPVEAVRFEPRGPRARLARLARVIRLLAVYRADRVICLRHGPDPIRDFVLREMDAKEKFALTWRPSGPAPDLFPHELRRHAWILASAGLDVGDGSDLRPRLASAASLDRGPVVVAPFSSATVKDWSDAGWVELVARFPGPPAAWELWVGPDQRERARVVAERMREAAPTGSSVTVRSGTFRDLITAIGRARLVLSVDTLAAHLATAADVPLVALLGGGQFGDFAPWVRSPRQVWLTHPLPCFHCGWACVRERPDCIQEITTEQVLDAIQAVEAVQPVAAA